MVLFALYEEHGLHRWGGINPAVWHRRWVGSETEFLDAMHEVPLSDNRTILITEITRDGTEKHSGSFVKNALFYLADESLREARYGLAIRNIKAAGLVYEVLQVWNENPLTSANASLAYPLYIFDKNAREVQHEPSLQRQVNGFAITEYAEAYGTHTLFEYDGRLNLMQDDQFRYLSFQGQNLFPLSSYRLRYRPHNHDTAVGIAEQAYLVRSWIEQLPIE